MTASYLRWNVYVYVVILHSHYNPYAPQIVYLFLFLLFPRALVEEGVFEDCPPESNDSSPPIKAETLIESEYRLVVTKTIDRPRFEVPACHCTLHSSNFSMLFFELRHSFRVHVVL